MILLIFINQFLISVSFDKCTHHQIEIKIFLLPQSDPMCPFAVIPYLDLPIDLFFYKNVLPVLEFHIKMIYVRLCLAYFDEQIFKIHSCCCVYQKFDSFYC